MLLRIELVRRIRFIKWQLHQYLYWTVSLCQGPQDSQIASSKNADEKREKPLEAKRASIVGAIRNPRNHKLRRTTPLPGRASLIHQRDTLDHLEQLEILVVHPFSLAKALGTM